jgi:hypothetical protein
MYTYKKKKNSRNCRNSSSLAFLLLAWHATLEVSGPATSRCAELLSLQNDRYALPKTSGGFWHG